MVYERQIDGEVRILRHFQRVAFFHSVPILRKPLDALIERLERSADYYRNLPEVERQRLRDETRTRYGCGPF